MFKNVIVDRFKAMTEPPNPKLFKVFEHEDGIHIMDQPWGKVKKLTWKQAEKFLGMDTPKKPVATAARNTRSAASESSTRQRRKHG